MYLLRPISLNSINYEVIIGVIYRYGTTEGSSDRANNQTDPQVIIFYFGPPPAVNIWYFADRRRFTCPERSPGKNRKKINRRCDSIVIAIFHAGDNKDGLLAECRIELGQFLHYA